ncbi:MAG: hypothetical protein C0406_02465 [Sideroxydans sp.]|nr:hypothetical protein [Sideroxydans sp.]
MCDDLPEDCNEHGKALLIAATEVRSLKRDVDADLSRIIQAKMQIFKQSPKYSFGALRFSEGDIPEPGFPQDEYDIFESISFEVEAIRPSLSAPGIHLNNYLESYAFDVEWDEIKHTHPFDASPPSMGLRSVSIEVHWSAVMLAIKGALDRLVRVLYFYYPGIAQHTTWGRYEANGKASGFMARVQRDKTSDVLLAYFDQAYTEWIAEAVAPRDALTHYKDPYNTWHIQLDGHALISRQHIEDSSKQLHSSDIELLCSRVQRLYDLADRTFIALAAMQPRASKRPTV